MGDMRLRWGGRPPLGGGPDTWGRGLLAGPRLRRQSSALLLSFSHFGVLGSPEPWMKSVCGGPPELYSGHGSLCSGARCVYVSMCLCVCERESQPVCVCACVCVADLVNSSQITECREKQAICGLKD